MRIAFKQRAGGNQRSSDRATVHYDDFAIHERVTIADHKGGEFSEFFRPAETATGNPELVHLQPALRQRLSEICIKDSGSDGVDRDAEGGGLAREALCKTNHRGLRSRVMDGSRQRANRADGSDV